VAGRVHHFAERIGWCSPQIKQLRRRGLAKARRAVMK